MSKTEAPRKNPFRGTTALAAQQTAKELLSGGATHDQIKEDWHEAGLPQSLLPPPPTPQAPEQVDTGDSGTPVEGTPIIEVSGLGPATAEHYAGLGITTAEQLVAAAGQDGVKPKHVQLAQDHLSAAEAPEETPDTTEGNETPEEGQESTEEETEADTGDEDSEEETAEEGEETAEEEEESEDEGDNEEETSGA